MKLVDEYRETVKEILHLDQVMTHFLNKEGYSRRAMLAQERKPELEKRLDRLAKKLGY
jgi:hypothetical protein